MIESQILQIYISQSGETTENKHIPHGPLPMITQFYIHKPLYFFVGQEHAGLIIRCTFERQKGMTVYPALLNGYI